MNPIQLGNWVLILLGVCMVVGGPYLIFRTVQGELQARKSQIPPQWINSGINLLIGAALGFAGVLFIVNNLRGNPLA